MLSPATLLDHDASVADGRVVALQLILPFGALGSTAASFLTAELCPCRDQIVQGRVDKTIRSMCLMDAPFIKELSKSVDTVVKEAIAQIGENITIRRFERWAGRTLNRA